MEEDDAPKKKKRQIILSRDMVIRRLSKKRDTKPSPLAQLQEIFEEAQDKKRFVGDTMFWKYFEDIEITRIYHTNSVEYMNLKVMFWETLFYISLLVIFTIYVFALQNRVVFSARDEQQMYWSGCDSLGACTINKVISVQSFWEFMHKDLVDFSFTEYAEPAQKVADIFTLFPNNDFKLTWHPRFIGSKKSNVVLGTVRVRQLRVEKNAGCQVSKLYSHIFPDCYGPYTETSKSTATFRPRFAPTYIANSYDYKDSLFTEQASIAGKLADYGGDGYVVELPWNASDSRTLIGDLWNWSWVDTATRGIVVELTTLNTNVNILVNTRLIFEFGPTGSVSGKVFSKASHVALFTPATSTPESMNIMVMQFVLLGFFGLFFLYVCWLMFKTCKNFIGDSPRKFLKKQTWFGCIAFFFNTFYHYIRYAWNLVDLVMIGLFTAHIALRLDVYRAMTASPSLNPTTIGHPEKFMPLSSVFSPMVYSNNLLSLLAMIVWLKVFKYLCISSYFRLLVRVLEQCIKKLMTFAVLLCCIFFGFSVAFFVGIGGTEEDYSSLAGSFLVNFFLLIDGYDVNVEFFDPGKDAIMPMVFFMYIALVYFVLLNIAVAIILDTYATADRSTKEDPNKKNPMLVFLTTYYNMMLGVSMVRDDAEENMKSEDLSIRLDLLPGVVRRKWIEKKRKMQRIANETFAGMELYPVDLDAQTQEGASATEWMLPSSRTEVFDKMNNALVKKPMTLYDIPEALSKSEVSRAQLQRLMDEDETLPILLQEGRADKVIRRFKQAHLAEQEEQNSEELVNPVQRLQGQVFTGVDTLERVKLDEDLPEVPEISGLTEALSDAITSVRNKFRIELTGIIEATAVLFEHLVDLTQGIDTIRDNHEQVLEVVREATEKELLRGMGRGFMKR